MAKNKKKGGGGLVSDLTGDDEEREDYEELKQMLNFIKGLIDNKKERKKTRAEDYF